MALYIEQQELARLGVVHVPLFAPARTVLRQAHLAWQFGLIITALGLIAVAVLLPLKIAAAIIVLTLLASAIVVEPRIGLYTLTVTVPWGAVAPVEVGGFQVTLSDVIVGLLCVIWAARALYLREGPIPSTFWNRPIAIFLFAMLLSTSQATDLTLSAKELLKWLEFAAIFFITPAFLRTERDVARLVAMAIAAAVSQALLGLGQFVLHAGPANFVIYGRFMRAYGTFDQPNPLAGYLNIILPLTVAWAWVRRSWPYWVAAGLIELAVLATFSRAGWAAGVLGLVVVAMLLSARLRPWPLFALLAGVVALLLSTFSLFPTGLFLRAGASLGITSINFQHPTTTNYAEVERAAHWVAGLRMFIDHPFLGVGIGNYPIAYPAYHIAQFMQPLGHAHNYFINIAAEAGVFGLLAYLLFLGAAIWYSLMIARGTSSLGGPTGPRLQTRAFAIGIVGAWGTSTFHNLFDVLYVHALPTLLGLLMGALLAINHWARQATVVPMVDHQGREPQLSADWQEFDVIDRPVVSS
jgi:O-antigen ligase